LASLQASELFEEFQQLSPSEFFRKNKQMLGFTGPIRSLTMVFHELITNSFDAAEEAGILPEIKIELQKLGKDHYLLKHSDNGPGIPEKFVMQVYCSMFAGSKFRNIQSRGQQGLGCSGCVLLSQMTTGEPAKVQSAYRENGKLKGIDMTFKMDVKKNKGLLINKKKYEPESTGVSIELQFKDVSYTKVEQGAFEYIRRTMVGNPHAQIIFRDPDGKQHIFKRAAEIVPVLPQEVLPHPKGITADDLHFMAKHTDKKRYKSLLTSSLSRMSIKKVAEIGEITGIDLNKRPKNMEWEEAEKIVEAISTMKFMAPPTSGLIPIGDEQIKKGMEENLKPEFVATTTRKPATYRGGVAFIIEAGIAYGGDSGRRVQDQRKSEIMRFANRVPLTFDQGSCGITEALKSIEWRRYGLKDMDNLPLTVFVNIISTQVPYLSTGKQSVSPEEEILFEIKQATMKVTRKLQRYLSAKKADKERALRSKIFEEFVPLILREAAILAETDVPEYKEVLSKVTHRALAELMGEDADEAEERGLANDEADEKAKKSKSKKSKTKKSDDKKSKTTKSKSTKSEDSKSNNPKTTKSKSTKSKSEDSKTTKSKTTKSKSTKSKDKNASAKNDLDNEELKKDPETTFDDEIERPKGTKTLDDF
jgi:DNA topoisomerase-6 subunit B